MKSTISSKGQVTVPVEIRAQLGLRAGTAVVFEPHPQGALMRKRAAAEHPVDRLFGSLKIGATVDAALDAMRGPRAKVPGRKKAHQR
jgi:AbrB family looped-hinge helix DNA binding protein